MKITILKRIVDNLYKTPFVYTRVSIERELSSFDGSYSPIYKLHLEKSAITEKDLINPINKEKFAKSPRVRKANMKVISFGALGYEKTILHFFIF